MNSTLMKKYSIPFAAGLLCAVAVGYSEPAHAHNLRRSHTDTLNSQSATSGEQTLYAENTSDDASDDSKCGDSKKNPEPTPTPDKKSGEGKCGEGKCGSD
jgi:uncharacterized low-complexity protein